MLLWKFMCTHKQPVTNQQESFEGRLSYPVWTRRDCAGVWLLILLPLRNV
jgi:hypothetical protein